MVAAFGRPGRGDQAGGHRQHVDLKLQLRQPRRKGGIGGVGDQLERAERRHLEQAQQPQMGISEGEGEQNIGRERQNRLVPQQVADDGMAPPAKLDQRVGPGIGEDLVIDGQVESGQFEGVNDQENAG